MGGVWGCVCPALIRVPHNRVVPLNISPGMAQLCTAGTGAARLPSTLALPEGGTWGCTAVLREGWG